MSEQTLTGGEIVTSPGHCADNSTGFTITLKRLRLQLHTFEIDYSGGGSGKATVEGAVVSLETPIQLSGTGAGSSRAR